LKTTTASMPAAGGLTVGILPGPDSGAANPWIDVAVATDMGHARNAIIIRSADAVVAVGGEYGTLSEVALALKMDKPVVSLRSWEVSEKVLRARDAEEAVDLAFRSLPAPGSAGG
jgi:uncharacterized protein (TIGR00725 family)